QQISVNPQALQFGVVGLGRWQAQNLWVRNLGDRVLKVSDIVSSDGQFTVNITNFTVEPGQSYPVTVTFRPVQADTIIANLTIYSDDPVTRSLQVGLFGRGRQLYEQQISVTPDSLYFGTVATTRSSAQYLWVSNLGEEPLTIFNIRTSNSQFTVSDTSFSIVPGASRLIMVNFRPAQVGAVHAALLIISDDPVNDSLYVALYGIGREPHPQQISLNPETLNFGTVLVNQSRTQYLWVANEGDLTLTVSRIVSSDNQFTVQDTSFAVGPEGSHSVAVTFRPTHAGTIEASLTIFSDDPERKSLSVPLFGKATTDTVAGDWHLLTDQGDTYNEDVLIDFSDDLYAKVWCFYLRSAGAGQPVYMKVFRLSQTQPPSEQTVGYGTNLQQNEYQTVRACLNKVTGDVWVAIQGSDRSGNRGYFVVYDSTAKLKREPTWIPSSLGSQTNDPRIACDSHGRMWLNWVSGSPGQANAQGEYICYNPNGTVYLGPQTFTSTGYVNSTDIAIDSNDRVWMLFNQAGNRQYFTILNNNGTVFKPATLYAENTFQFDNRRQVFADVNNERVWILRRNANVENQALRIYDLNGNPIAQVSPVGHCSFVTNEKNRLEVVQYKNQKYQVAEFHPRHGGLFTNWTTLFDSTYAPVTNGLACNWANPRLKAYLAQTDTHVTKAYFQYVMSHVPIISVLPRTLDFGEVTVGTSRSDTLWVRNLGTDSLRITKLAVSNAQFTVNKTPFVLAPGKTRSLLVTFLPNKPDTVGATLTISSNDPMNEEVFVPLFGMGFITKGPQIAVAPAHLEFGEVAQGKSATMQLRVTNLGGDTLKVTAIASSDTQFVVTDKTFKVPSQQSHLVAVMFRPAKLGKITGTLTIRNNDPRNDSLKVPVSGTGRTFRNQQIVIEPDTLRFGRVALGRSQTLYVTISNPGDTTLQIYYIAISDTAQFTVYPASFEVASNGYRTIAVTFRPDTIGAISGTVTIYSNDPDSKRKRLQLPVSGTGYRYEGPLIVVNPEFLNFGTLVAGGSRRLPLYVKNTGKRELRVSNIYFSYTYDNPYSVDQTNFKVAQGDSKRVWVTFHPTTSTWTTNNILYISSNDSTNLVAQVPLTGSVEQAALNSLNWNLGYAPFGTPGSTGIPYPYTSGVLDAVPDTAWFIKDIYLSSPPTTAMLYVAYDDLLQLYINGRQVLNRTVSTDTMKYWSDSLRVESFLVTGVNRIAAVVYNIAAQGGFDCQLLVNGVPRIKEGRVHYGASETQWWYLTNGALLTADAFGRQWFSFDYGLTSSDSVVARWTFDESFGDTLQDASRFGRRGIKHGTSVVTGVVGNGLLFDGLDDYVQIETNIDHVPLTLQVWINCSGATAGRQTIISNEQRDTHGHGIFLNESLRLGVQYHGPQGQTGERVTNYTIQPNTWYFLTVQYIGNMVKIYVNGVPVDSVTYTPTTPDAYTYTFIGRNPALETNPRMFKGKIDEVAILNVATRVTGVPQVAKILKPESLVGELGSELKMVFPLHPNPLRVLRGRFRYAVGGSSNFQTPDITEVTDSTVTMTIPKDKVTLRGLKCRLELETSLGKITYPPASSADTLFWVKTHTSGEKSAMHLKGERYRMISVPFQLEDSDINAVLKDDLGEQSPYDWRLFQWEPSSGRYLEFPSTLWGTQRGFKRGQAFWLITWLDKTFDTGAGWSADNIEPFPILLYPGWNQIADPFPFPVAWDSVEANGHISDLVYYVSQDTIGYHRHWKILEPWEGYFVYNNEPYPVTLYVPPIESGAQLPKSPGQFAMNLHA
ncbi:MAG: choice-of-anchor D domain-containing protein, partial [candidate division KSB1 bacterium]|nr:choice-of-anchor D domain-containing protein [candidate division KSB1 bacterium]